jgi:hypothetical protein
MINQIKWKMVDDNGDVFWYLPQKITLPTDSSRYLPGIWQEHYSLSTLANIIYGDKNYYWLILKANNLTNPWQLKKGQKFKILKPDYLNEIVYG